jgi:hypothetical protein
LRIIINILYSRITIILLYKREATPEGIKKNVSIHTLRVVYIDTKFNSGIKSETEQGTISKWMRVRI